MAQGLFTHRQDNQAIPQNAWTGTYAPTFVESLDVAGGGGGSGGSRDTGANAVSSGAGGSGIVVIRYPSYLAPATATTGSPDTYIAGAWRVYVFTANGTITF